MSSAHRRMEVAKSLLDISSSVKEAATGLLEEGGSPGEASNNSSKLCVCVCVCACTNEVMQGTLIHPMW